MAINTDIPPRRLNCASLLRYDSTIQTPLQYAGTASVRAPSKAWSILQGESPCWVRAI